MLLPSRSKPASRSLSPEKKRPSTPDRAISTRIQLKKWPAGFRNFEPLVGLQIALAPEPAFHRDLELVDGNAMAGFKHSIACGKRIVEDRIVGEVAHGEAVDLADRASVARAGCIYTFNGYAALKHGSTLNEARRMQS